VQSIASAGRATHNLPAQPGPLVGREADVARAVERLLRPDVRLLSLVGAGGAGKTRLGIEVAAHAGDAFPDGTHFVDLAPISEPGLFMAALARVLDVRERRERPLFALLQDKLALQQPLLVLDNFEQLLPAAPQLANLLQACPTLKVLVTSRSALRLRWENVLPVPPLTVPNLAKLPELDALAKVPAVALFTQRAQRVDPAFELTQANARAVAELCVRLDGLPLAIELAAARLQVLPPQALLKRLGERLDLVATTNLDQPPRQRTLRAAIDASYDLLSPAEQALFRRLSVFVGGFSLDAIPEVCDADGSLGVDALAGVESLVDKSLLRQERDQLGDADTPRFGMLETIREYALERLADSGERDALRRRHAAY
jgi:predicted ATPase